MSGRKNSDFLNLAGRTKFSSPAPIKEVNHWLHGLEIDSDLSLIDVSQAAPNSPPPLPLRQAISDFVLNDPKAHLYGDILGMPALRNGLANHWSKAYKSEVADREVAITAGCNQAFCSVMAAIANQGDEVILPTPWYFNHKMWLDMIGIITRPLGQDSNLYPNPEVAAKMINSKTKAIVLVNPNNPTGLEYTDALLQDFYNLAKSRKITLILDETYKDFSTKSGPPHTLLKDPDWKKTLVQLYSFSKVYRLTGHRVGAIIGSHNLLTEIEKFLDTVTICPSQVGQYAALWGLENLSEWVAEQRTDILQRQLFMKNSFGPLAELGWELRGCGAYFAYVKHPFELPAKALAQKLVAQTAILALPGEMFAPTHFRPAEQYLRLAFANVEIPMLKTLLERLANFRFQLAP